MAGMSQSLEERLERALHSSPDPLHGKVQRGRYACDMHVHSNHSTEIPPLPQYSPLAKMVLALEQGMHYFCLTDHNTYSGVLELQGQFAGMGFVGAEALKRFIPGVEIDVYVESLVQAIHVNVYGLNEKQWQAINAMYRGRDEIRDFESLTAYLKQEKLLYSFNHPFWKPFTKNSISGLVKRILPGVPAAKDNPISLVSLGLIFPEFPLIELNGSRIEPLNDLAEYFALVHGIPLAGGSDDHYAVPLGNCYTIAPGKRWKTFLEYVAKGKAKVMRSHLDEDLAVRKAEHVVELFLGGSCDTTKYLGELVNMDIAGVPGKLVSLWKPKYFPLIKKRAVKIGTESYLQSQYSCLPPTWMWALMFGKKSPVREALERLREKQ